MADYPAKRAKKTYPTLEEYENQGRAPTSEELGRNRPVLEQLMLMVCREELYRGRSDNIVISRPRPSVMVPRMFPDWNGDVELELYTPGTVKRIFAGKNTRRSLGGVDLRAGGGVARNSLVRLGWAEKRVDEYKTMYFPPPDKCSGCKHQLACLTKGI